MQLPSDNRRRWRSRGRHRPQGEIFRQRFLLLKALIVLLFGVLVLQLARMQIVEHDAYQARAEINRLRLIPDLPTRGLIFDRYGEQLVYNVPIFSAAVIPADVPKDQLGTVVAELSSITGVPSKEITEQILAALEGNNPFTPVVVQQNLDEATAFLLRERLPELPGVQVLVESMRSYPSGALAAALLGYVGRIDADEYASLENSGYQLNDRLGKTGVELIYESMLRGTTGYRQVEFDVLGREIRTIRSVPPRPGDNLVLSLDLDLQRQVEAILQDAMGDSKNGVAAVMDVRTGEMLAMVSLPSYDNNLLTDPVDEEAYLQLLNDPAKPLVNHAIAEVYPPGSTFKEITGSAALQEGVATPDTRITSRGFITVRSEYNPGEVYIYRDWAALGTLDFYGGLAQSSDVYYYYLSGGYFQDGVQVFRGLGAKRLAAYAREYGLGALTGIDLPGEAAGLVPDPTWKQETIHEPWTLGDTYNFGIGQGYLAITPLQLLRVTAAIANGGDVLVPHVLRGVIDEDGNILQRVEREVAHTLSISDQNLAVMREALRQAAEKGTAQSGASRFVTIAGKTGTAEFGPQPDEGEDHPTHGWYTGFAPFANPEIAVVVFLQQGKGGRDAGPVASQIFDYYFGRERLAEESLTP